jgi:hypothetical protein
MRYATQDALILIDPWGWNQPYADTIFEEERKPEQSKILDSMGRPLWKVPEPKQAIGFDLNGGKTR